MQKLRAACPYKVFPMTIRILGIESTCDETACAIVEDGEHILGHLVSSQIDLHREYGGVVPELACRRHIDLLIPIIEETLMQAKCSLADIDAIAVAKGPGLVGALLIGMTAAKSLSLALSKPFLTVNHVEAHLFAAIMSQNEPVTFPCIGVVLSGGHTTLLYMQGIGQYELIGQTVDDAIGEAFDKVAKMLELPYPGGPEVENLALGGDPHAYMFKSGRIKNSPFDFSFSGIKTSVLYKLKEIGALSLKMKQDICASFQEAVFADVLKKAIATERRATAPVCFLGEASQTISASAIFLLTLTKRESVFGRQKL